MKQPKKLTREQKVKFTKRGYNPDNWSFCEIIELSGEQFEKYKNKVNEDVLFIKKE